MAGSQGGPKQETRGRPVTYTLPERIDADPDTIAETVLKAKPKKYWRYEKDSGRASSS